MSIEFYPFIIGISTTISFLYFNRYSKNSLIENLLYFSFTILISFFSAKIFFLLINKLFYQASINIFQGGYVFYGGLIGGLIFFLLFYSKKSDFDFSGLIPTLCLGHSIGRIACYAQGCCYGSLSFIPVQLVESLILFLMFLMFHKWKYKNLFFLIFLYLFIYSLIRFNLEFLRADKLRGFYLNLSISQWISLFFFFLSSTFLIRYIKRS